VFPQGEKPVFRVRLDDGATAECCDEHLWYTTAGAEAGKGSVKPLAEIRRTLHVASEPGRLNHRVPTVAPVELAPRGDPLFLSPYLLGLLLADQSLRTLSEREGDAEAAADAEGVSVSVDGVVARVPAGGRRFSAIRLALEHYGLSGLRGSESFIPDDYLGATPAERLDLLRGLLDADGEVAADERAVDFATSSRHLADGVVWLVRSLGGLSREEKGAGDRASEPCFRVRIWFPSGIVPITSKRHLERWNARSDRFPGRFIESVEPIGTRPCQCILVDSDDHLYVTSDFVLTHNTAFCLNIATHVGCRGQFQKKRCGVGIFSLEMPKEQLVMRMLASEARVDSQRIRTGKLIESDWAKLAQAAGVLADANIHIDDTPAVSALELRAKCRRLFAKYQATDQPIRLIVVDYLQLMRGNERLDNREQQISEISRSLKALAKELAVPVLALSQLNRSLEKRPDKRPMMSDLRESGAIEQDSDTILFIYREEVYEKDKDEVKGVAEIIVGKQRNGPIGTTNLAFIHEHTRFENLARGY
jgi:replicative DNA helicase